MKVNDSLQNLEFPENNCLILDEKESYASTGRRYKTLTITVPVQMRSSHVHVYNVCIYKCICLSYNTPIHIHSCYVKSEDLQGS